jgi:hypothetical protein
MLPVDKLGNHTILAGSGGNAKLENYNFNVSSVSDLIQYCRVCSLSRVPPISRHIIWQ